jgi:hypothetical protein
VFDLVGRGADVIALDVAAADLDYARCDFSLNPMPARLSPCH